MQVHGVWMVNDGEEIKWVWLHEICHAILCQNYNHYIPLKKRKAGITTMIGLGIGGPTGVWG